MKLIKIHCNVIDCSNNIYNGNKSDVLVSLPITSTNTLKGQIQEYFDIGIIPINKNTINQIIFSVSDHDNILINVGKILLEFYSI